MPERPQSQQTATCKFSNHSSNHHQLAGCDRSSQERLGQNRTREVCLRRSWRGSGARPESHFLIACSRIGMVKFARGPKLAGASASIVRANVQAFTHWQAALVQPHCKPAARHLFEHRLCKLPAFVMPAGTADDAIAHRDSAIFIQICITFSRDATSTDCM